ncbi:hypothetical protein [Saccharopolyspora flava]|nr:hypothetical protein [Saccharopolyspora flava]
MRRSCALALAAGVAALALGGCGTEDPAPEPKAVEKQGTPGLPKGVSVATDVPVDVPNNPEVRRNVQLARCEKTETGWRAAGTARNPGQRASTYAVTVFFTTDTATVIGTGAARVDVPAGGKTDWEVAADFTAPDKTLCVLRGAG